MRPGLKMSSRGRSGLAAVNHPAPMLAPMSYVIFGRRDQLGRVASRPTVEAALAEICRMEHEGFTGVELTHQFQEPTPARLFRTQHAVAAQAVCGACPACCADRVAA